MVNVIHVGGRGKVPEPWTPFADDFSYDVFDADAAARIQDFSQPPGRWSIHACGVGEADAERVLNINVGPTVSSLFQAGLDEGSEWFHELGRTDYMLSRALRPVRTEEIEVRSVDSMVHEGRIPSPHWLRIDAQGAECEILRGAKEAIRTTCVACTIESNLTDMYTVGKTFGEVHNFLDSRGWYLASFEPICGSLFRYPFGARGRPIPFAADVLYLRDPRCIIGEDELKAAALISTCLGFTEFGVAALNRLALLWPGSLLGNPASAVDSFLSEMAVALEQQHSIPAYWDHIATTGRNFPRPSEVADVTKQSALRPHNPSAHDGTTSNYDQMLRESAAFEEFLRSWNLNPSADCIAKRRNDFMSHLSVQEWEQLQLNQKD